MVIFHMLVYQGVSCDFRYPHDGFSMASMDFAGWIHGKAIEKWGELPHGLRNLHVGSSENRLPPIPVDFHNFDIFWLFGLPEKWKVYLTHIEVLGNVLIYWDILADIYIYIHISMYDAIQLTNWEIPWTWRFIAGKVVEFTNWDCAASHESDGLGGFSV